MNLKTTRRRMLSLAAALPAMNFLKSLDAQAQGRLNNGSAKRVLFLYHSLGTSSKHWYGNDTSETGFDLGYTLKPMQDYRDDMVILRNMDNQAGCDHSQGGPCKSRGLNKIAPHSAGINCMLAPQAPRDFPNKKFTFPGGETLDWTLARKMQQKYKTPYDMVFITPSNPPTKNSLDTYSTRKNAGGQLEDPVPERDPLKAYNQFLAGKTEPGGMIDEETRRKNLARELVSSHATEQVIQYQKALPSELKPVLDAHVGELRDLEERLSLQANNSMANSGGSICQVVNPPTESSRQVGPIRVKDLKEGLNAHTKKSNYKERAEIFADIAVAALSCNVSRVVNLCWWTFHGSCSPPNLAEDKFYTSLHLGLQHNRNGYKPQDTADAHQAVAYQNARIMAKLKAIPEGDSNMLDNTLIVWTTCLGMDPFDGPQVHNKIHMPFVLAGKAGGALKTGRMIDYKKGGHGPALSAVSHLAGFPVDAVGDPYYNKGGPSAELLV